MLKHCSGEVVEAVEAYCDYCETLNNDNIETLDKSRKDFENEIADIIVCCLIISGYSMIDIEQALNRVMEKNKKRQKSKEINYERSNLRRLAEKSYTTGNVGLGYLWEC